MRGNGESRSSMRVLDTIHTAVRRHSYLHEEIKTLPYEVEKRVKIYIQEGLESACQSEILARIKFIALDTLKARKQDKLTQLEKMCIELAYDLALIDLKQSRKPEKPPDAERTHEPFDPKDLLDFYRKNEENTLSNTKDLEHGLKGNSKVSPPPLSR